jgi:NADH-quinone oxidoreductase subunit A
MVLFFFLQNVLIFGLIFWALTFGGEYFFKVKNQQTKKQFYECGFKSLSDANIQFNVNFALLCVFLILYDIEFVFLMPFLFNIMSVGYFEFFLFCLFTLLILVSLFYDWQMNALSWQF